MEKRINIYKLRDAFYKIVDDINKNFEDDSKINPKNVFFILTYKFDKSKNTYELKEVGIPQFNILFPSDSLKNIFDGVPVSLAKYTINPFDFVVVQ